MVIPMIPPRARQEMEIVAAVPMRKEGMERDVKEPVRILKGPGRCGFRGCRKAVKKEEMGCREKEKWEDLEGDDAAAFSLASSQPTNGQEQMNPDEICLDNEDEVEFGA